MDRDCLHPAVGIPVNSSCRGGMSEAGIPVRHGKKVQKLRKRCTIFAKVAQKLHEFLQKLEKFAENA